MQIKKVGVIGAGTMGNGIAHVFARSGCAVVLCDVEQRFLNRGLEAIIKNLDREVARNKISADEKASALRRIDPVTERAKLADCDFIVEAATEKFEIKAEIFRDLDRLARPEVILASNTPSISITKLAALTELAEQRLRGAPAHRAKGVEATRRVAAERFFEQSFGLIRQVGQGKILSGALDFHVVRSEFNSQGGVTSYKEF